MESNVPLARISTTVLATLFLLSGCHRNWGEDDYTFGHARELGTMNMYPGALTQEGAFSIALDAERTLWVFGETLIEDTSEIGFHVLSNCGGIHRGHNAPVGDALEWISDSMGILRQLVPYSEAEQEQNMDPHTEWQYRLWPVGGFCIEDTTYLFVVKAQMQSYTEIVHLQSLLVRLDADMQATRLYGYGLIWGYSARIDEDGYIYFQGKRIGDDPNMVGYSARAPLDSITDYLTWDFYNCSENTWSQYSHEACRQSLPPTTSIAFDSYLDSYVAVRLNPWENSLWIGASTSPIFQWYGPYFTQEIAHPPHEYWATQANLHPTYQRDNGQSILISYWSQEQEREPGLHFIEFEFHDQ